VRALVTIRAGNNASVKSDLIDHTHYETYLRANIVESDGEIILINYLGGDFLRDNLIENGGLPRSSLCLGTFGCSLERRNCLRSGGQRATQQPRQSAMDSIRVIQLTLAAASTSLDMARAG